MQRFKKGRNLKKGKTTETLRIAFLVSSAKLGNRDAFQLLAKLCHGKFLAHGWRLTGDKEAASEVTQQAWIEIVRGLPKLKDDHMFLPWAYRIVTRMSARWIKAQQKSRRIKETAQAEPIDEAEMPDIETQMSVAQAISCLPTPQQAALALFYREELSVAEISIALDIPVGTVKSRLSQAREKLRKILERE